MISSCGKYCAKSAGAGGLGNAEGPSDISGCEPKPTWSMHFGHRVLELFGGSGVPHCGQVTVSGISLSELIFHPMPKQHQSKVTGFFQNFVGNFVETFMSTWAPRGRRFMESSHILTNAHWAHEPRDLTIKSLGEIFVLILVVILVAWECFEKTDRELVAFG